MKEIKNILAKYMVYDEADKCAEELAAQLAPDGEYWKKRCEELFGVLKVVFYSAVKPEENPIAEWEMFIERNNYKELYEQFKSQEPR